MGDLFICKLLKVELTVNAPEIDINEYQIQRKKLQYFLLTYRKYLTPPYIYKPSFS